MKTITDSTKGKQAENKHFAWQRNTELPLLHLPGPAAAVGAFPGFNKALEAIAQGAGTKHKRGRPEKILADAMIDPKIYRLREAKGLKIKTPVPSQIREYTKIVLDNDAIRMAIRLAGSRPIEILHMLDAALPPSKKTWIEWSSEAALDEMRKMQSEGLSVAYSPEGFSSSRPEWARCGVMIEELDEAYSVTCVENGEHEQQIFEWPVRFAIAKSSEQKINPFKLNVAKTSVVMSGSGSSRDQAAIVWGYQPGAKGISNLLHKGTLHVAPHMTLLISTITEDEASAHHMMRETAMELSGLCRQVVAILAMLHTSMEVDAPVRPSGRFMIKGGDPKPFSERRIARLLVPGRVRNTEDYVRARIKDEGDRIRKRLHKVKAHYRHSRFLPLNGENWTKCYCPGREPGKFWHKRIDEHWRGDESLGVIDHTYTLVSGSSQGD